MLQAKQQSEKEGRLELILLSSPNPSKGGELETDIVIVIEIVNEVEKFLEHIAWAFSASIFPLSFHICPKKGQDAPSHRGCFKIFRLLLIFWL
jgi:hypothetical protein